MKKVLIIVGGLALIGGGVYFYSKKKKEQEKANKLKAISETTPTNAPTNAPKPNVNSELSPISVAYGDDEIKLQKAKSIVKQYTGLSKSGLLAVGGEKRAFQIMTSKLKKIGYTYKDGLLKKI